MLRIFEIAKGCNKIARRDHNPTRSGTRRCDLLTSSKTESCLRARPFGTRSCCGEGALRAGLAPRRREAWCVAADKISALFCRDIVSSLEDDRGGDTVELDWRKKHEFVRHIHPQLPEFLHRCQPVHPHPVVRSVKVVEYLPRESIVEILLGIPARQQ